MPELGGIDFANFAAAENAKWRAEQAERMAVFRAKMAAANERAAERAASEAAEINETDFPLSVAELAVGGQALHEVMVSKVSGEPAPADAVDIVQTLVQQRGVQAAKDLLQ